MKGKKGFTGVKRAVVSPRLSMFVNVCGDKNISIPEYAVVFVMVSAALPLTVDELMSFLTFNIALSASVIAYFPDSPMLTEPKRNLREEGVDNTDA